MLLLLTPGRSAGRLKLGDRFRSRAKLANLKPCSNQIATTATGCWYKYERRTSAGMADDDKVIGQQDVESPLIFRGLAGACWEYRGCYVSCYAMALLTNQKA
jgi:hypothetical protein